MSEATTPAEQRVLDVLAGGPKRFRDLCDELSAMSEGEVARILGALKIRSLADHRGAEWSRTAAAPAPAGATVEREAELLQCPHCPFQTKSPRGYRAHVALKHRTRASGASGSKSVRMSEKPKAPAAPKVLPPAPPAIESTLERVRRIRDAAAQAVQALEALTAAGFVV